MKPTFILLNGKIPFVFVVPPLNLSIQMTQIEKNIELIDFGEIIKLGEERPSRISFSTFLPSITSNFFSIKNPLAPIAALEVLKKWKKEKKELTFTVPEMLILYRCNISSITAEVNERTGDMDIQIELIEKRTQDKITDSITGLFKRS